MEVLSLAAGDLGWRKARGRDALEATGLVGLRRFLGRLGTEVALVRTKEDGLNWSLAW
jgi:hypothetical protein